MKYFIKGIIIIFVAFLGLGICTNAAAKNGMWHTSDAQTCQSICQSGDELTPILIKICTEHGIKCPNKS